MENQPKYRDINNLIEEGIVGANGFTDTILDINKCKLTSLKGIERFQYLETLSCEGNFLTNLDGLENNNNLEILECRGNKINSLEHLMHNKNLRHIYCYANNLTSLKGIEELPLVEYIGFWDNPCYSKYNGTINEGFGIENIKELIFIENSLIKESELRGKASIMDTELFC